MHEYIHLRENLTFSQLCITFDFYYQLPHIYIVWVYVDQVLETSSMYRKSVNELIPVYLKC